MESKVNYTIVGLFVVILTAVIIFISLWLTVGVNAQTYKTYLVYMNESVAGLTVDAPVKYNGVNVGYVSDMKLNRHNPQQVILILKIYPSAPITQTTEAVLMQQGLTGIAYIGLQGGANAPPLVVLPGEVYPIIRSAPSFFVRLDLAIQGLTNNVSSLSNNLKELLDQQNLVLIHQTLQNLQQISGTLASNSQNFNQSMKSLNVFLTNAAAISTKLPTLVQEFQTGINNFNGVAITAHNSLQSFTDQVLPQTNNILQNTQSITNNAQMFMEEFKQNPNIILRGTQQPAPGPGE